MGEMRNAQTEVSRFLSPSVNGLAMYFLRDMSAFLSTSYRAYRDNDMIFWIFTYCSGSRVLHVTLTNPQTFGFEFHLRSLSCAFSRRSVHKPVALLFAVTPR